MYQELKGNQGPCMPDVGKWLCIQSTTSVHLQLALGLCWGNTQVCHGVWLPLVLPVRAGCQLCYVLFSSLVVTVYYCLSHCHYHQADQHTSIRTHPWQSVLLHQSICPPTLKYLSLCGGCNANSTFWSQNMLQNCRQVTHQLWYNTLPNDQWLNSSGLLVQHKWQAHTQSQEIERWESCQCDPWQGLPLRGLVSNERIQSGVLEDLASYVSCGKSAESIHAQILTFKVLCSSSVICHSSSLNSYHCRLAALFPAM